MHKKLTISIDSKIYYGLRKKIGPKRISRFIEDLVRPHVSKKSLEDEYREMAKDKESEAEALEWIEALIEDVADDPR